MLMKQRSYVIISLQAVLIVLSVTFAWLLRFDFHFQQKAILLSALPVLIVLRLAALSRLESVSWLLAIHRHK